MLKRPLMLLAALLAAAPAAQAGSVAYTPIPVPIVGPVHAQYPSFARPYGRAPAALGFTVRWTQTSEICRYDFAPGATCWLRRAEAVGSDCGCPPYSGNTDWIRGVVSAN